MRAGTVPARSTRRRCGRAPPTGPRPSIVGMPHAPVQQPSETPPESSLADRRGRARAACPERRLDQIGRARHRRPGAAVDDLERDAVVGAGPVQLGQRVVEVGGNRRADVDRARGRGPGTVLAASPPATVVITEVISGRPAVRPSMRSISVASAETALRPRAVSAPAWAGAAGAAPACATPRPCGHETRSPFSRRALEHERRGGARGRGAPPPARAAAPPRRRRPAAAARRTAAAAAASRSIAIAASTRPPFMSATPGPVQRSPSRRNGRRRRRRPAANTVSVWPSSATIAVAVAGSVTTRLRAGLSGSSTHAAGAAERRQPGFDLPATRSCSRPQDGESMSTSRRSRSTNVVGDRGRGHRRSLPDGVWLRCRYGSVLPRAFVRAAGPDAVGYLQSMVTNDVEAIAARRRHLRTAAHPEGARDRRPGDLQHRRRADLASPPEAADDVLADARAGDDFARRSSSSRSSYGWCGASEGALAAL